MTSMTAASYDAAIRKFLDRFNASVISGRRTPRHTKAVGGFAGDPHSGRNFQDEIGFWTDVEYDVVPDIHEADAFAADLGLLVLREHHANGDHLQPRDWKNDPQ